MHWRIKYKPNYIIPPNNTYVDKRHGTCTAVAYTDHAATEKKDNKAKTNRYTTYSKYLPTNLQKTHVDIKY